MGILFLFYSLVCCILLIVSESFSSSMHHLCSPTEAFALLQFKQSFQIDDLCVCWDDSNLKYVDIPKTKSWNENRDCCSWDGVTCDMLTGHVIGLDLSCSLLDGTIHPNSSLFQLHHLRTLNLAYNNFHSSLVSQNIGRLANLRHLNLSHSFFEGEIPTEISYLSNLVSLDLSSILVYGLQLDETTFETMLQNLTNLEVVSLSAINISSPIPVNISSSSLRYLDLESTNLQGVITESFFLVPELENLKLGGNNLLKGVLPKIHPSNNTLLELDISKTGISGELPDIIGTFSSLNRLDMYGCQFSGSIPDSIGNITQIRYLDFSYNHLTGHIPSTISKLKHLTILGLSSNSFSGEIPNIFSNLQELRYLCLSKNTFIGSFPSTIVSLTHLQELDLSSNSLSGPLPNNFSMLQKLTELGLWNNSLNGIIPSSLFSLPLLGKLCLDNNRFSGLPNELKTNPTLVRLGLSHNQLSGFFPQSLVNLTNLSTLDLSSNNITIDEGIQITFPNLEILQLSSCELKDFPHFLKNVKKLWVLDISNNKIRGEIPNWFSGIRWDELTYLNLSHNSLTGHLHQFHFHNLKFLDLKFNSLQGPLPSSICNMNNLEFLDLSRNNFSNSIPSCLGSMSSLKVLDLRRNNFTGSIPPLCAKSTSLITIVLNDNQFEGTLPFSLINCSNLEVADMGNNAINDTFPAWLGTLEELQVLILKSNLFHGPISSCQSTLCFPKLRIIDLSHNQFSGSLPVKIFGNFKAMIKLDGEDTGKIRYMEPDMISSYTSYEDSVSLVIKGHDIELERISTIMTTIDLLSNHFEGVIPKTLKDLSSLWLLNLSHNNLIGHIPMELGQLNKLEALDLSWNRLTGKIPKKLTTMKFLAVLNLSQNLLIGSIPQGLQFNTFENDSYGGNLDLCGPPLSKQCGTTDPSHVPQPLEYEDESYFFSGFTWESVVIGYSFGLVVGTVVWSLVFKYRKPKWFVEFFEGIYPKKMRRSMKRAQRRRT
ncbi:receptor-like protein 7 [Solanum pennellii]|uniref:Receptor-like protein 7 n=1 Tax=Solanum pennellii TaxID=28526 RepID=A0ABM1FQ15_SOLPN|nr:receptor-like protein 7 [Solanum pennellii]